MPAPILVTGATGTVGSRVVTTLAGAGADVRAASRHLSARLPERAEPVRFDFHDPTTFAAAFAGVRTCSGAPARARPAG